MGLRRTAMDPYYLRIAPILMKNSGPEAKFHGEFEFDVKSGLAPQKLGKKREKNISPV